MLTMNLLPLPDIHCVRIRADSDTNIVRLQRETPTGWVTVRMVKGYLPNKTVVIEDYECPFNKLTRYRVQAENQTAVYETVTLSSNEIVLELPHIPKVSAIIPILADYNESRKMPGSTDLIIGRTDPLITILPLQKRQGSLRMTFNSNKEAANVENLYAQGYPLLLRQPCHECLDMYHTAEMTSISPNKTGGNLLWDLTVQYVEQNIPGGDLIGTQGWDYQALANAHPDFVDMEASYNDYAAVLMEVRNDQ